MSNWSALQKLAFIICGGVLTSAFVLFFVFKPLSADIASIHGEVEIQKKNLHDLVVEESSYQSAGNDFARIKSRAEEIEGLFPVREKLVGHIEKLEQAAADLGEEFSLNITDVRESNIVTDKEKQPYTIVPGLEKIEVIPYDFQLEGTFLGIIGFLQAMENQPFYSEIERVSIESQTVESSVSRGVEIRTGRVAATMRAAFYAKGE